MKTDDRECLTSKGIMDNEQAKILSNLDSAQHGMKQIFHDVAAESPTQYNFKRQFHEFL